MDWWWLLVVLAQVTRGLCDSEVTQALHDVVVALNTLRPITQTSDKFLGITISPRQLLNSGDYSVAHVNMLQALSPGYLRVGGPESENLAFKTSINTSTSFLLTESQWMNLNQLAADTGLHLIFSLSPKSPTTGQLLSFSNNRGYDITWQLAYRTANINGTTKMYPEELKEEVLYLRRLIDSYPRYQNAAVLGPDLEFCEDPECLEALKEFLLQVNDASDIVVLQMKPEEDLKDFKSMFEKLDKISNEVEKSFPRDFPIQRTKYPLKKGFWVAEAENADHTGGLRDAMTCALSLGHASRLGYHTFLLHLPQLSQPSPGYWTALLYRALVGRVVLGARVWPQEAEVAVFAACTATESHTTLDTEWEYGSGAMTVWGVNSAEESTHISLRAGPRLEYVHLYVLTYDDRYKDNILLNGQPLRLVHGVLPRLSPRIRMISLSMSVTVPARSVFFIVLPDTQAPACLISAGERLLDSLKKENVPPLVMNIPIPTSRTPSVSWKPGTNQGDVLLEKGGIFSDATVNKDRFATDLNTEAKKDIQDRIEAPEDDVKKNIVTKIEQSEEPNKKKEDLNDFSHFTDSNIVPNKPPIMYDSESNPVNLSNASLSENFKISVNPLPTDIKDEILEGSIEKSNEYDSLSEISVQRNESYMLLDGSSPIGNNSTTKINQTLETKVPRVRRSEDYDYFEPTRVRETESSPLYRRVNLLRRILNKMQQSKQYEEEERKQHFRDFTGTVETPPSKNKQNSFKISKKYSEYPIEIPTRRTNSKDKEQTPRVVQYKKEENINYLPGEFYEVLGGLKIDSNVSLKDKEDILEATDSLQKHPESHTCNDYESKLKVTKKPENDPQEDRRIVELATESSQKYYVVKNRTTEHQANIEKPEDSKPKITNNNEDKLPQTITNEDMSENDKEKQLDTGKLFQSLKTEESDEESVQRVIPFERTKREINNLEEDLKQTLKLTPQNIENEGNNKKSDFADEVELRRFLEELTNEGEQILQTIDEEYDSNIENSGYDIDTRQFLTTEPIPIMDRNKTLFGDDNGIAENKTEESDFYLKHNILIDNEVKPKRKYLSEGDNLSEETTKASKDSSVEIQIQLSSIVSPIVKTTTSTPSTELSIATDMLTSGDSNNTFTTTNSSNTSTTEEVDNSDMFIEGILPQTDKTTKSGIKVLPNVKLETSGNLLYNDTDNTNSGYTMGNSSKVSGINEEITEVPQKIKSNSLTGNETDQHNIKSDGTGKLVLITKIADLIAVTEKISNNKENLNIMNKNTGNTSVSPFKPNTTNVEVVKEVEDNNYKVSESDQQHAKPGTESKSILSVNISDIINTSTEMNSNMKKRVDSESQLVSNILPPPSKPLLILRPLSVSTLNRNLSLPKKIDIISNKISEFNSRQKLSAPVLERTFSMNTTFSDKYKERLEAIKQRLQKARERLLNLTIPRAPPSLLLNKPLKVKREIITNKDVLNNLFNRKNENQSETEPENQHFISTINKTALKPLKRSLPASDNLYLIHRLIRQIDSNNDRERDSGQFGSTETDADTKKQPSVITPYYFSAIKKWVIPLSNNTENMLYNNKLFPVNLYGIVSDKWVQHNIGASPDTEERRRSRALHYPCVKDKFNDFEAEDESAKLPWSYNAENGKISSVRSTKPHSLTDLEKTVSGTIFPQMSSSRSKRATNKDIEMNELEMKALLTNAIFKEKPTNDVPDHENVFSSMLHKTLSKTVTNKTGIERMFELAKNYQETNPSSLEIFSTKNKQNKKLSNENVDKTEKENTAVEETGDGSSTTSTKSQMDIVDLKPGNNFKEDFVVKNSSIMETTSTKHDQNTDSLKRDKEIPDDAWSDFIHQIQEFFESVTSVIKKQIA